MLDFLIILFYIIFIFYILRCLVLCFEEDTCLEEKEEVLDSEKKEEQDRGIQLAAVIDYNLGCDFVMPFIVNRRKSMFFYIPHFQKNYSKIRFTNLILKKSFSAFDLRIYQFYYSLHVLYSFDLVIREMREVLQK